MKPIANFLIIGFLITLLSSCNNAKESTISEGANFEVVVVDSLEIDYLGNLWLINYDASSEQFLAYGNGNQELVILDKNGVVLEQFEVPRDGPNSVSMINAIGMTDGQIRILEFGKGLVKLDQRGKKIWNLRFPYFAFYLNGIAGQPFFDMGREIAFIRPEKGDSQEIDWDEDLKGIFESVYHAPILEIMDTISLENRETMPFPPGSSYQDGNFYGWTFPAVLRKEKDWFLFLRGEMNFYHYQENAGEIDFVKEVSLQVNDAVPLIGVPFEKQDDFWDLVEFNFSGRINQVLHGEKYMYVIYEKGLPEEFMQTLDQDRVKRQFQLLQKRQHYLAVFDQNLTLLENEISLPKGLIYTNIVTDENEILGLKNQDYFEEEKDQVVYYKLKLEGLGD
ncbi:hypothetical protein [Algoriphagus algorifonticola]|uniref:hypothetical protein n=1 Tax=Algoriphagus algorifonticola TaxID=2593007 RepID=UPI00119FC3A0|nr:hypothetical protein [Algoriphagus algorifonticola]